MVDWAVQVKHSEGTVIPVEHTSDADDAVDVNLVVCEVYLL